MKSVFKPQIETLEDRLVMTATADPGMYMPEIRNMAPPQASEVAAPAVNLNAFAGQTIRTRVDPADYSAIAFVGGWGASSYQYAFQGTYAETEINGIIVGSGISGHVKVFDGATGAEIQREDDNGHGTHVAGTIGAVGNSAADHEFGHTLDVGPEHSRSASSDDVWVDGKVLTGQNFATGMDKAIRLLYKAQVDVLPEPVINQLR